MEPGFEDGTCGTLAPQGYLPRIVDKQIERYLRIFGAVEIAGTKWCGKTWTALSHGRSVSYIDDDYGLASADPSLVTLGEAPHVIDEWQLVPRIWDAVRRAVDRNHGVRGGWILTGSSTPLPHAAEEGSLPKHSGAGRFARVRMHPMSLAESGDSTGAVSLSGLFGGRFKPSLAPSGTEELLEIACRGGFPQALGLDARDSLELAREYLRFYFAESVPRLGRRADYAERILASVARNVGQAATFRTIARDMYDEADASRLVPPSTISAYLDMMRASYLIDEVPGWVPQARSRKRLSVKPKRYLADPSLVVAQLGLNPSSLLRDWQTFGLVFEGLCMRDLAVYALALPDIGFEPVRYYRDDTGLEADAIIELADGRWAAFEVKVSDDKVDDALDSLRRLRKKLCGQEGSRTRPPEFMAVLTGLSRYAREVEEGLYVIPIRSLTA